MKTMPLIKKTTYVLLLLLFACDIEDYPVTDPVVRTDALKNITTTTARGGGEVTFAGGGKVTEYGFCWGTSQNPTLEADQSLVVGAGTGAFTATIEGLRPQTAYHLRAYATNQSGTAYGEDMPFTTLAPEAGSETPEPPVGEIPNHW